MLSRIIASIKHLNKHCGSTEVLRDISLQVTEGEIYGIIGQSGAGKTTLMACLMGLEDPSGGEIQIEGENLFHLKGEKLRLARQKIGVVFQQYPLLSSRTALENVNYPFEISGKQGDARELLRLVGLEDQQDLYPSELSGGQKQRVAIARALALKPRLLLFDEPTSALDPETTDALLKLLLKLNQELKLTMIIITHEMGVIRQICHRVAVLDKGRIVEAGRVVDVFTHPNHRTTQHFLNRLPHDIPSHLHPKSPQAQLLRLCFASGLAEKGIISLMIKRFNVDVNILLGAIDILLEGHVGNLVIELKRALEERKAALSFLRQQGVEIEELVP